MERQENAVKYHNSGYNCAESVIKAYANDIKFHPSTALSMACGFGGGLGRTPSICGAVAAACMLIGAKEGSRRPNDQAKKLKVYDTVREFTQTFTEKYGSINCCDLIGVDLSTDEGLEEASEKNLFHDKCNITIENVIELLEPMLIEPVNNPVNTSAMGIHTSYFISEI